MYLSCVEEVIPLIFAYDRHNYPHYLVPFLNDMGSLPVTIPEVRAPVAQLVEHWAVMHS